MAIRIVTITMLMMIATTVACTKISGTAAATGPALGDWSAPIDTCSTADRERLVGAYLRSTKNPNIAVKIVKDAFRGVYLAVSIPSTCQPDGSCQATVVTREMCSKFQADVFFTSVVSSDDYRAADGHLFAECVVPLGAHKSAFTASVRFVNCQ